MTEHLPTGNPQESYFTGRKARNLPHKNPLGHQNSANNSQQTDGSQSYDSSSFLTEKKKAKIVQN